MTIVQIVSSVQDKLDKQVCNICIMESKIQQIYLLLCKQ